MGKKTHQNFIKKGRNMPAEHEQTKDDITEKEVEEMEGGAITTEEIGDMQEELGEIPEASEEEKILEPVEKEQKDVEEKKETVEEELKFTPPPPASIPEEGLVELNSSTYPVVTDVEKGIDDTIIVNYADAEEDIYSGLVFDKRTINDLIVNYMDAELVTDEATSMLNTVENQKARQLVNTLNKLNNATGDKAETRILSYLSIYLEPTTTAKNPGMLMQLIAKEINEAKTISDLDMSLYILTRIFKHVASFHMRSFLKIGSEYHSEFKVHALQMVEVFSQLATAEERKAKIGTIISLQKSFKTSTTFLTSNGAKLVIEYFSK